MTALRPPSPSDARSRPPRASDAPPSRFTPRHRMLKGWSPLPPAPSRFTAAERWWMGVAILGAVVGSALLLLGLVGLRIVLLLA